MVLGCLPPAEAARALIDLACLRGGPDNITAVIVRVLGPQVARGAGPAAPALPAAPRYRPVHPLDLDRPRRGIAVGGGAGGDGRHLDGAGERAGRRRRPGGGARPALRRTRRGDLGGPPLRARSLRHGRRRRHLRSAGPADRRDATAPRSVGGRKMVGRTGPSSTGDWPRPRPPSTPTTWPPPPPHSYAPSLASCPRSAANPIRAPIAA